MAWNARRRAAGAPAIVWIGCVLAAAGLTAGCTEDDSSGEGGGDLAVEATAPPASGPSPEEMATQLSSVLAKANTRKDCEPLNPIIRRSLFKFACPAPKKGQAAMKRFEILDSAVYGAGAVVDYQAGGGKDTAMVLMLNQNRQWIVSRFGLIAQPSVGTKAEDSRETFDTAVDSYLRAVRTRNCELFIKRAATSTSKREIVCKGEFKRTKQLADILKKNPRVEAEYYGGNSRFAFYRLPLLEPSSQSLTLSVFKQPSGSDLVLNVMPGPETAATTS